MHFSTLATLAFGTTGWAAYTLQDDYFAGGDFFQEFSFWDGSDPTHGFVQYARHDNLLESSPNNAKMWVSNATDAPNGRESIRITSNKSYQSGLVILDVEHMPGSVCGTWPAFWMVGPDWPNQGEIDIIEGVNTDTTNQMTLHTGPGCSIDTNSAMTGSVEGTTCAVSGGDNTGCGIKTSDTGSYGDGLNEIGGGVYATEWTSSGISVYFFPRSSIPSDISSGSPQPSSWGTPTARFAGGCNFESTFRNQQIVFDTTFCGDWAGASDVWGQSCAASTGRTCQDYVATQGQDFEGMYWSINSLKVYQGGDDTRQPNATVTAPAEASPTWGSESVSAWTPAPSVSQPGWAPIVSGSSVISGDASSPATSAPAAPSSPAESPSWEQGPSQTSWGGDKPWQSNGPWSEHENKDGSWSPGAPAHRQRHARHLRQHKAHGGARH